MARGGFERPPRWALIVMIVGAAVVVVMSTLAVNRQNSVASGAAPSSTPTEATPSTEAPRPVLAVFGDSFTAGSDMGGRGDASWPVVLANRLSLRLDVHAQEGAGYITPSAGKTLPLLAEENPNSEAAVVIVFAGRNDGNQTSADIRDAAAETFSTIRFNSPNAQLVVVGPSWALSSSPDAARVRDAVKAAADEAKATFVDPVADQWFADQPAVIGADRVHPTDEGHVYMADRIEPLVTAALAAAGVGP